MQWNSVAEFFAMGGYAVYVWPSFGACAILMMAETFLVKKTLTADYGVRRTSPGATGRELSMMSA